EEDPFLNMPPESIENILPTETPTDSQAEASRRVKGPQKALPSVRSAPRKTLFRMGLKGGANYSYFQSSETGETDTGIGYEGHVGFSWDLAYQPFAFEFEGGYRPLLVTAEEDLKTIP